MLFYKKLLSRGHRHRQLLALVVLISGLTACLSYYNGTETLDWLLYDSVQQLSQLPPADDLVIIDIDEQSINALGRWPWSRNIHAKLIDRLREAGTAAVAFDVIFADEDRSNPSADKLFAEAISKHGRVVLPLFIKKTGLHGQVLEVPPAPLFYRAARAIGHVHVPQDRDGVVRSVFLMEGVGSPFWPHISLALWQLLEGEPLLPGSRVTAGTPIDNPQLIARNFLNYFPMPGASQGLRHYSFVDVLNGEVNLPSLSNKTVFIGATATGLGDKITTSVGSMSGVELNAWVFQGLRHRALIQEIALSRIVVVHSVLVLVLLLMLGRLSPRAFLTASLCTIISLLLLSCIVQLVLHRWLPIVPAVLAVMVFYPLWNWRRLEAALGFLRQELIELNDTADQGQQFDNAKGREKNIEPRGTELISQTIGQLVAIKHRADANKRLIQQSLAELQDAVVISDLYNHIIFTNNSFNDLSTVDRNTPVDLIAALTPIELDNNQYWADLLQNLYLTKVPFAAQGRHRLLEKDMFCQGRLANIGGKIEDTLIITFTDISQLKAAEKARTEALNFLSHDLRSPMVSVLAIIDRQYSTKGIDQSALKPIEVLVRKNLDFADRFLQLNRAESLQTSQLHPCDLHSVLDSAQVHALALVDSKKIKLITDRVDVDAWVMGDQDLLERAVINLLSNAVKFSPTGSTIRLSLSQKGDQYQFRVSDQGCGIDSKDLPTLFDRFTRPSRHQNVMGAGLGLHFVATVARRHQGSVSVDSIEQQGSTFVLSLKGLEMTS